MNIGDEVVGNAPWIYVVKCHTLVDDNQFIHVTHRYVAANSRGDALFKLRQMNCAPGELRYLCCYAYESANSAQYPDIFIDINQANSWIIANSHIWSKI